MLSVGNEYQPATSLLEWMRKENVSTGTKEMCLEGGCGLCLVTVSLYDPTTATNQVYTVNSVSSLYTSSSLPRYVEMIVIILVTVSLYDTATATNQVYTVNSASSLEMSPSVLRNVQITISSSSSSIRLLKLVLCYSRVFACVRGAMLVCMCKYVYMCMCISVSVCVSVYVFLRVYVLHIVGMGDHSRMARPVSEFQLGPPILERYPRRGQF